MARLVVPEPETPVPVAVMVATEDTSVVVYRTVGPAPSSEIETPASADDVDGRTISPVGAAMTGGLAASATPMKRERSQLSMSRQSWRSHNTLVDFYTETLYFLTI